MTPLYFLSSDSVEDHRSPEQQWFFSPFVSSDDELLKNMCTDEELIVSSKEDEQVFIYFTGSLQFA